MCGRLAVRRGIIGAVGVDLRYGGSADCCGCLFVGEEAEEVRSEMLKTGCK